jgi:hypothetical protein
MKRLPDRLNLDHLKKQAKDLIRLYRHRDPEAIARFRHALPAAADRSDDEIASLDLRLHDAQSCVARDCGFASWADLRRYVELQAASGGDRTTRVIHWLKLVYSADVTGTGNRASPRVAVRMLAETPDLVTGSPYLACAIGDEATLRAATAADPSWLDRPGGPLKLPPLVAVTTRVRCARVANASTAARSPARAGADPNQRIGNRRPPGPEQPDDDTRCPRLYGAPVRS